MMSFIALAYTLRVWLIGTTSASICQPWQFDPVMGLDAYFA